MYTHCQKCQYMMTWDENGLIHPTIHLKFITSSNLPFSFIKTTESRCESRCLHV